MREVAPEHAGETLAFLHSETAQRLVAAGSLIGSTVLEQEPVLRLLHPRVEFISYPWEWPAHLWLAAADLTLDLSLELLKDGRLLKDATPLNILFRGSRPVLVDVLSVERADLTKPIWLAYGQFVRTFLLPLLAYARLGWPLHTSILRRDGFEPEEIYAALGLGGRMRSPALTAVTLPTLLAHRAGSNPTAAAQRTSDPEVSRHVLARTLNSLRRQMHAVAPQARESSWSGYTGASQHYPGADHAAKRAFVRQVLASEGARRVLDIGANTGEYSRIAADAGASVVAVEADEQAAERLAVMATRERLDILPLRVDIAHPTPAVGWQNRESMSFLERATGNFDTVLMLAVLHHLLVGAQVPLPHIAELAAGLTTRNLVVEWVPLEDPKFQEILRGRGHLYTHLTESAFRAAFGEHFRIASEQRLGNGRTMFHLVRPNGAGA